MKVRSNNFHLPIKARLTRLQLQNHRSEENERIENQIIKVQLRSREVRKIQLPVHQSTMSDGSKLVPNVMRSYKLKRRNLNREVEQQPKM